MTSCPRFASRLLLLGWGFVGVALVPTAGCASQTRPAASASTNDSLSPGAQGATLASSGDDRPHHIMAVHRSKCGACHTPVSPGSVPRVEAEAAMHRHRRRAKLSEREWNDMVEYISNDGDLKGQPTARLP